MDFSSSIQTPIINQNQQIYQIQFAQTPNSEQTHPNPQSLKKSKQQKTLDMINYIQKEILRFKYLKQHEKQIQLEYWQNLSNKFAQLIHWQSRYTLEIKNLMQMIVQQFVKFPEYTCFLEYFDYVNMCLNESINKQDYTSNILNITKAMLNHTLLYYQSNKIEQSQDSSKQIVTNIVIQKQLIEKWRIYIDVLRSFAYFWVEENMPFSDTVWLYYGVFMGLMLPDSKIQVKNQLCVHLNKQKYADIVNLTSRLSETKIFNKFYHELFHEICMYLRVHICNLKQFLNKESMVIASNQKYLLTNNCQLLMRMLQSQFTNPDLIQTAQQKLDCLCLLMALMSTQLPRSANYNQVLQFTFWIILYLTEQQEKNMVKKNAKLSEVSFYCGQLLCMIMHRNIYWILQFCRNSQNKSKVFLKKVIKLFERTLARVMVNITKMDQQEYVYTRIILGFCALLRIQNMEEFVIKSVKNTFPNIVRIIQIQYGWQQEQPDGQGEPSEQFSKSNHKNQKQQSCYETQQKQQNQLQVQFEQIIQPNSQKLQESAQENAKQQQANKSQPIGWNQQFYHKNKLKYFQNIDQIQIFKKSMLVANENKDGLFDFLMNNFSEKQIMLWVVELQKQNQQEDQYECQGDDSDSQYRSKFERYFMDMDLGDH